MCSRIAPELIYAFERDLRYSRELRRDLLRYGKQLTEDHSAERRTKDVRADRFSESKEYCVVPLSRGHALVEVLVSMIVSSIILAASTRLVMHIMRIHAETAPRTFMCPEYTCSESGSGSAICRCKESPERDVVHVVS